HTLDRKVIAEGVETEEQARLLRLLRCEQIQGNVFSPAVPRERIEALIAAAA
ncbi:MAG: EAL domain-containing protein, partial [Burkholderiales bacterium]